MSKSKEMLEDKNIEDNESADFSLQEIEHEFQKWLNPYSMKDESYDEALDRIKEGHGIYTIGTMDSDGMITRDVIPEKFYRYLNIIFPK